MPEDQETNYTQGYSKSTVASHASRTVDSDAAFLKPYIKPSDIILDIGCGPGTITVGFAALVDAAQGGSVTGVDISDEILAQARETAADAAASSSSNTTTTTTIQFQKADVLVGLPFADESFSVLYASQLFPHLATPEQRAKALAEMRRVLKPGGVLATRDAAELHFYPRRYGLDRLWAGNMVRALRPREQKVDACFPGGDMPALFRSAGFGSVGPDSAGKLIVGAGTTVYSDRETRKWFAEALLGRLQAGDAFRESWRRVGITDEVGETCRALEQWAMDEDAWYVAVQAEILGWK
ncbi:hypothetical protein PG994_012507 [Apiospora phragmitis]|uniref:Methyltransferase domain-containing protein n=1 Tax=Apiospora phragmitis TaxID=2905665 RepID=A0ABR1TW07_9PEZI